MPYASALKGLRGVGEFLLDGTLKVAINRQATICWNLMAEKGVVLLSIKAVYLI